MSPTRLQCLCVLDLFCVLICRLHRDARKDIVKRSREGCAPLFIACKRGNAEIADFLVTICDADLEQRGMFENPEDQSVHCVTPLWCAAVSGKLNVVRCLVRLGANVNAMSDTGSSCTRSACFLSKVDVVQFLVENGADINKPNFNGGTCLINAVQSMELCEYLISKGADVNAKDIQNKTALHYAIHEHRYGIWLWDMPRRLITNIFYYTFSYHQRRLETTKLLLDSGADPFAKSRHGDDALQTACLKGAHHIFDLLKSRIEYSTERLASANELIGSTYLDEHNETRLAILHWRLAHHIRLKEARYICKLQQQLVGFLTKQFDIEIFRCNFSETTSRAIASSLWQCDRVCYTLRIGQHCRRCGCHADTKSFDL